MSASKICTKCKKNKTVIEFGMHKFRKDGLRSVCKKCNTSQAMSYAILNKDRIGKYQKEYKQKNKTKLNEQIRMIKESNKDHYDLVKKLWKLNNREKIIIYNQNRKARKRNQVGKVSSFLIDKLLVLQKNQCANCKKELNNSYHLDHVIPISLGGKHDDENLELLCPKCNLKKSNKDPIVWANENGRML